MTNPLRVRDFMCVDPNTIEQDAEIMSAVQQLVDKQISGLPVLDANGELVGILTERDCIAVALQSGYFDESGGSVKNFMSAPVRTIDPDDSLMDLAQTFAKLSYRRLPVVKNGRLVGLISRRDVLRALTGGNWFLTPS
jgi:CBS domain-containing protein